MLEDIVFQWRSPVMCDSCSAGTAVCPGWCTEIVRRWSKAGTSGSSILSSLCRADVVFFFQVVIAWTNGKILMERMKKAPKKSSSRETSRLWNWQLMEFLNYRVSRLQSPDNLLSLIFLIISLHFLEKFSKHVILYFLLPPVQNILARVVRIRAVKC